MIEIKFDIEIDWCNIFEKGNERLASVVLRGNINPYRLLTDESISLQPTFLHNVNIENWIDWYKKYWHSYDIQQFVGLLIIKKVRVNINEMIRTVIIFRSSEKMKKLVADWMK